MVEQGGEDAVAVEATAKQEKALPSAAKPPTARTTKLQPGCHVVLRDTEGGQKIFKLDSAAGKDLRMGRYLPIPVSALLGLPYGATLRREGSTWARQRRVNMEEGEAEATEEVTEDNRNLAQSNNAQALTPEQIQEMKRTCTGEALVEAIASNSSTFSSKTKFAQEKYLKKKNMKHVQQVTLLRPTIMELCETYMKTSRQKTCSLRFDYLSSIFCQADVRTGGSYLVLDCTPGLVVGGIAQRLAGHGRVYRVFSGGSSDKAVVELDMGEACRSCMRVLPLDLLQSDKRWEHQWVRELDAAYAAEHADKAERVLGKRRTLQELEANPVDAFIAVVGDDGTALIDEFLALVPEFLAPGGRVAIYGQYLQPIAAHQGVMRAAGNYVDVRMIQLFTREYQVLPQRTHPHMQQDANHCEGYLLTASKVIEEAANGEKRRRVGD